MDCGDDDGESGAEEEQESSSPAPSGFTCRKKGALAADLSSLPRPTTPRGHPKGCPPVPAFPVLSRGSPDLQDPPQPRVPPRPRNWGSPPQAAAPLTSPASSPAPLRVLPAARAAGRPHSSDMSPGHCAATAGKAGRHGSGAGGVHTAPRSRRGPAELLKAPHEGGACSRRGHLSPGAAGGPARSLPGPPPPAGDCRTAGPWLGAPRSPRHAGSPPPAGGTQLITGLRAQSDCFLDVNHPGAGNTRLKGARGGGRWSEREEKMTEEGVGRKNLISLITSIKRARHTHIFLKGGLFE